MQYQALKLCTGAYKTTPTEALQVKMGDMPLAMRGTQLSLSYWVSLQGHCQDHPTQNTLKPAWEKEKKVTKSFGWAVEQTATDFEIVQLNICPSVPLPTIQPWILPDATVDFTILGKKDKDREFVFKSCIIQEYIDNNYYGYIQTDASKNSADRI